MQSGGSLSENEYLIEPGVVLQGNRLKPKSKRYILKNCRKPQRIVQSNHEWRTNGVSLRLKILENVSCWHVAPISLQTKSNPSHKWISISVFCILVVNTLHLLNTLKYSSAKYLIFDAVNTLQLSQL